MKPGIDPKVDYAFKKVFGSEETKDVVLVSLLNAVLAPPAGKEVVSVTLENPFNEKDTPDDRYSILDVKARDAAGRWFDVEMQMAAPKSYPQRVAYYWAKLYVGQLGSGENFADLRPAVSISFLDSRRFSDDLYHHRFRLRDDGGGVVLTDHLEIHVIELPKFGLEAGALTTGLDVWCYFLQHGEELDTEKLPPALDVPPVRRALEVLTVTSLNSHERELYEGRLKARRDRAAEMQDAREEGESEGLRKGELIGRIRTLEELLGLPVTARDNLARMTDAEREELADRLRQQAAAGKG
jgi:predicted transposase/invertase (TIGR01784 family)